MHLRDEMDYDDRVLLLWIVTETCATISRRLLIKYKALCLLSLRLLRFSRRFRHL